MPTEKQLEPIRVALIDTQISLPSCPRITNFLSYSFSHGHIVRTTATNIYQTHGDQCLQIIAKYLNTDIAFFNLAIMKDFENGNVIDLIQALKWCFKNQIHIINLSCGTTDPKDGEKISHFLQKYNNPNSVIVAAQNNYGLYTYPANLSNTIGVRCIRNWRNQKYHISINSPDNIDIEAAGIHTLSNASFTPPTNSFATAYTTALCINTLPHLNHYKKNEILKYLKAKEPI